MAKTNSNSITSILIYALNNEKYGFRKAMLERFNEIETLRLPNNIEFYDGTHQPLSLKGMNGKQVDIYGMTNNKPLVLIEIKANINEDLQAS